MMPFLRLGHSRVWIEGQADRHESAVIPTIAGYQSRKAVN
jgi:hypothetical protein